MSAQAEHPNLVHNRNGSLSSPQQPQQQSYQHRQQDHVSGDHTKQQPNVRHIPIYVEGRDEPLVNRSIDTSPKSHQPSDLPNSKSSGGIFDRVRKFPTINRMHTTQRSNSPHRTVPINMHRSTSAGATHTDSPPRNEPQYYSQQQNSQPQTPRQQTPPASADNTNMPQQQQHQPPFLPQSHPDAESILKIQNIQREVLDLMDQVERFTGNTRKDRQYLYLDEMLTQNLLKLDTIDTEGKENIKLARREAIKCINKCIAVLEAKADSGGQPRNNNNGEQIVQPGNHHQQTTGNPILKQQQQHPANHKFNEANGQRSPNN